MPVIDLSQKKGIHLALGGGAARGLAHIGVLKVLEEENIPVASICGSSMGAMVGGLYALHGNTRAVTDIIRDYISSEQYARSTMANIPHEGETNSFGQRLRRGILIGKSIAFGKVMPFDEWYGSMRAMIPDKTFKDTHMPFMATGLDLTREREVLFNEGNLRSAIIASCSIPGVFPPVKSGDTVYVDGGWVDKVPVRPLLQMGAREILAVDVSNTVEIENPEPEKLPGYSIILKSYSVVQRRLDQLQIEEASLLWRMPVKHIDWADFSQMDAIVELGEGYAREHVQEVKTLLKRQSGLLGKMRSIPLFRRPEWRKPAWYKQVPFVKIGSIGPLT